MKRSRKLKINVIKKNHTRRKKRKRRKKTKKVYDKDDFRSGDGMLTSVWGPSLWHYLHTMSFNYPVKPTKEDKKNYKKFIVSLKHVFLANITYEFTQKLKRSSIKQKDLKDRHHFHYGCLIFTNIL